MGRPWCPCLFTPTLKAPLLAPLDGEQIFGWRVLGTWALKRAPRWRAKAVCFALAPR